ncbi:hypothetical protein G6F68_018523 [Rhizopus microsporus]|nr:hypothetical protein G6F68_018523 [Rhizopus microsporus]
MQTQLCCAVRFHVAVSQIDGDVLRHLLLRVQADAGVPCQARDLFRVLHQDAAISLALRRGRDRDVVQQQTARLGDQDQHSLNGTVFLQDMHHAFCDTRRVIVAHGAGRRANARDVRRVGIRDDPFNNGNVVGRGRPYHLIFRCRSWKKFRPAARRW